MSDPDNGRFVRSWASLSGTIRNCSGGPTPWGMWLTCEETTAINPLSSVRHGYILEVPANGSGNTQPMKAMGRFSDEAVAVDPATGWVYETEDANPSGLSRLESHAKPRPGRSGRSCVPFRVPQPARTTLQSQSAAES